jgi:hypothetical protein
VVTPWAVAAQGGTPQQDIVNLIGQALTVPAAYVNAPATYSFSLSVDSTSGGATPAEWISALRRVSPAGMVLIPYAGKAQLQLHLSLAKIGESEATVIAHLVTDKPRNPKTGLSIGRASTRWRIDLKLDSGKWQVTEAVIIQQT